MDAAQRDPPELLAEYQQAQAAVAEVRVQLRRDLEISGNFIAVFWHPSGVPSVSTGYPGVSRGSTPGYCLPALGVEPAWCR
jgi:hypothetical protein